MNIPMPSVSPDRAAILTIFLLIVGMIFFQNHCFNAAGLSIELPTMESSPFAAENADEAVAVLGQGRYIYDGTLLDGGELENALCGKWGSSSNGKRTLLLYCDRRAPIGSVLRGTEIAKKAGFDAIHIAISPKS
jgi:biopolymer transport protein ExbD